MRPRLRFGDPAAGVDPVLRATAFGIVVRDGRIACVRVDRGHRSYFDLPGGAVDGHETEAEALVREFVEETGLAVVARERFAEAEQAFLKSDGSAVNNVGGYWTVAYVGDDPAGKVEDDHELVWLDPARAVTELRHDAHAWAVTKWMRQNVQLGLTER